MRSRLMDVEEAAHMLGIAPKTLYKWVESGSVPVVRIGRLLRFREGDLSLWVETRVQGVDAAGVFRPRAQ